ncbi:MAG TPA: hypothetical protein VIK73_03500 [Limnochordales bacterium]|mgnify:CR=1 FL=1
MILVLRILFYVQLLLGAGRFMGLIRNERVWETHFTLALVIAVLALVAFRGRAQEQAPGLVTAARLTPLLPLATGLAIFSGAAGGRSFVLLHILLALTSLSIIEMTSARLRKADASTKAG